MTLIDDRTSELAEKAARSECRSCGKTGLKAVLDLGSTPLADRLLKSADAAEDTWPLSVAFCPHCTLVQILDTVQPEILFDQDYPYFSSFTLSGVAADERW